MGMYDYLAGEQVKCFYIPVFNSNINDLIIKDITWHSGGLMRDYNIGDKLPLNTLYYKYPKDFIIFDINYDPKFIFIVKDGKLNSKDTLDTFIYKDFTCRVFDYRGIEYNIKRTKDFYILMKTNVELQKQKKQIANKYFGVKDVWDVIKDDIKYYDSVKDKYHTKLQELNSYFCDKWLIKDKYWLEKQFGELIDCYFTNFICDDEMTYKCKQAIIEFVDKYNNIINKYLDWSGNDKELEYDIKEIIK